jgi:hypothetical protein
MRYNYTLPLAWADVGEGITPAEEICIGDIAYVDEGVMILTLLGENNQGDEESSWVAPGETRQLVSKPSFPTGDEGLEDVPF